MRGGPIVLEITQNGGALAATMTGGMGGGPNAQPRPISDVQLADGVLTLSYTQTMGQSGQSMPIVIKLTPEGVTTRVTMDIGGNFQRTGTATKE